MHQTSTRRLLISLTTVPCHLLLHYEHEKTLFLLPGSYKPPPFTYDLCSHFFPLSAIKSELLLSLGTPIVLFFFRTTRIVYNHSALENLAD
jgi:hypothetical protein